MGSVLQKFDADASAVEKELATMRREYDKLLSKIDEVGLTSEKSGKKQETAWERNSTSIKTAIGSYVSLAAAAEAYNQIMERQIAIQQKSHEKSLTIAQSQAAVRKNIGDISTVDFQNFLNGVQDVQKQTGFSDLSQLNAAAADVLSATGSNQKQTLSVLKASAPIFRDNPAELAQFAGGVADLMSASGSNAEEATALALAGFGNSRTTSLTAFKNVAQSIKSGQAFLQGVDGKQRAEEITGLFGTLSRFSGDSEGSTTRTSSIKFLQKLEEFGGTGSTLDRLGRVQSGITSGSINADEVLKGFEAQSLGAVRDILTNAKSEAAKDLVKTIKGTVGSEGAYRRLVGDLTGGTAQLNVAGIEGRLDAGSDAAAMSGGGQELAMRDQIKRIYERATSNQYTTTNAVIDDALIGAIPRAVQWLTGSQSDFGSNFVNTRYGTNELLNLRESELRRRWGEVVGSDGVPNNELEKRDANLLGQAVNELMAIRKNLERPREVPPLVAGAIHDERD